MIAMWFIIVILIDKKLKVTVIVMEHVVSIRADVEQDYKVTTGILIRLFSI